MFPHEKARLSLSFHIQTENICWLDNFVNVSYQKQPSTARNKIINVG